MPLPRHLRTFSLRTLLVLVGVVCLFATWLGSEYRVVQTRRQAIDSLDAAPGVFFWLANRPGFTARAPWHRALFGDEPVAYFLFFQDASEESRKMAEMFPEARVLLDKTLARGTPQAP